MTEKTRFDNVYDAAVYLTEDAEIGNRIRRFQQAESALSSLDRAVRMLRFWALVITGKIDVKIPENEAIGCMIIWATIMSDSYLSLASTRVYDIDGPDMKTIERCVMIAGTPIKDDVESDPAGVSETVLRRTGGFTTWLRKRFRLASEDRLGDPSLLVQEEVNSDG